MTVISRERRSRAGHLVCTAAAQADVADVGACAGQTGDLLSGLLRPVGVLTGESRLPGLRISRRGVRWSVGPRWLRLHTGGGYSSGVSTGAGPVTWYRPLRRRRR